MTVAEPVDPGTFEQHSGNVPADYTAPGIVEVLRPEDLVREVHYAGIVASGNLG